MAYCEGTRGTETNGNAKGPKIKDAGSNDRGGFGQGDP